MKSKKDMGLALVYTNAITQFDVMPAQGNDGTVTPIVRSQDCALIGFTHRNSCPLELRDVGKLISEQIPRGQSYEFRTRIMGLAIKAGPVGSLRIGSGVVVKLSPENMGAGVYDAIAKAHMAFMELVEHDNKLQGMGDAQQVSNPNPNEVAALRKVEEVMKAGVSAETLIKAQNGDPNAQKQIEEVMAKRSKLVTLQ